MKSKIAVIHYKNYTENVDLFNYPGNEKALKELIKSDKDIVKVEYFVNGRSVGDKNYTSRRALSLAIKANNRWYELSGKLDRFDSDRYHSFHHADLAERKLKRETDKAGEDLQKYIRFIKREDYESSELESIMCCDYSELW